MDVALDNEYFDAINIDVVKKKYYNANKVEAVFADIRAKAAVLNEENSVLRAQLEDISGSKEAIGDLMLSVRRIAAQMLLDAQEQADAITADAKKQAEEIVAGAQREADEAAQNAKNGLDSSVLRMQECFANMKQHHLDCVDAINREWQSFLCSLYPEDADCAAPEDLESKVSAIAKELEQIEEKEDYTDGDIPPELLMLNDIINNR